MAICLGLLFARGGLASSAGPDDGFAEVTSSLTRTIRQALNEKGVPSISIALVKGDSIVWKDAFGYANHRTKTPASPETIYHVASTFKSVTAAALVQLAERGKLCLDDPVNRHLGPMGVRDRIQSDKPVTAIHVLSHWSGLTSWPGRGENAMKSVWSYELPQPLEQVVPQLYSIRAPEAAYEYNNYGFAVAGLMIEKLSGMGFEEYVVQNILRPIGISTDHPVCPSPDMVEMMAIPYDLPTARTNAPRPAAQVHTEAHTAGGSAYLTAADMAAFLGALLNEGSFNGGRILSPESVREMLQPRFGGGYGLGINVRKTARGATMIRHVGRMPGMSSIMMGDVDAKVGVFYAGNATDIPFEIADAAIALLKGEPYPPPARTAIPVAPDWLDRCPGWYRAGDILFHVTKEGDSLYIEKNRSGRKGELFAEAPGMFFLKDDPASVVFEGSEGRIERMVVHPPNWGFKLFKRVNDPEKE